MRCSNLPTKHCPTVKSEFACSHSNCRFCPTVISQLLIMDQGLFFFSSSSSFFFSNRLGDWIYHCASVVVRGRPLRMDKRENPFTDLFNRTAVVFLQAACRRARRSCLKRWSCVSSMHPITRTNPSLSTV